MINNPENLSKDRLMKELQRRGIAFSPAKSKDYYVSIYKQHFAKKTRQRSEFSSDDEPFRRAVRAPRTPPRDKKFTKVLNVDHYLKQIASISDSELFRELKKNHIDAGPITGSTRHLYEKKLAKVLAEKAKGGVSGSSSVVTVASESDDEEFSSGIEEEEVDYSKSSQRYQKPIDRIIICKRVQTHQTIVKQRTQTRSQSYQLRTRPVSQQQKRPVVKPLQPKVVELTEDEETLTEESTDAEFARPYRASWCSVRNILQLVTLLLSFIVGMILFDYLWNGDSRIVFWAQTMMNNMKQQ